MRLMPTLPRLVRRRGGNAADAASFALLLSGAAFGQPASERIPVPLADPNRPVFLKVGLISGGITVKGYAGKEVIVEATRSPDDEDNRSEEKPAGKMKLIPNTSMGLTAVFSYRHWCGWFTERFTLSGR